MRWAFSSLQTPLANDFNPKGDGSSVGGGRRRERGGRKGPRTSGEGGKGLKNSVCSNERGVPPPSKWDGGFEFPEEDSFEGDRRSKERPRRQSDSRGEEDFLCALKLV